MPDLQLLAFHEQDEKQWRQMKEEEKMTREIDICDGFQLRAVDNLNWQVFEFREVNKRDGSAVKEWVPLPSYHGKLDSAVLWIFNYLPKSRKADRKNLKELIEELNKVAANVGKHATKFQKAMKEARNV